MGENAAHILSAYHYLPVQAIVAYHGHGREVVHFVVRN